MVMRKVILISILLASFAASGQSQNAVVVTVEAPLSMDESNRATWIVRVINTGDTPAENLFLVFNQSARGFLNGTPVSSPPNCIDDYAYGCGVSLVAPGSSVELKWVYQYDRRYGIAYGYAHLEGVPGSGTSSVVTFAHDYLVTNIADSGPGSLRQAITDMNRDCNNPEEPCAAVFRIDGPVPPEGWFTIRPLTPLPDVTARFAVFNGHTQSRHTGDTNGHRPEVMIDGSNAGATNGFTFRDNSAHVRNLAIGNFNGNGIEFTGANLIVERSHIGVDPTGVRAARNAGRGIQVNQGGVELTHNTIGANGRSGAYINAGASTVTQNRIGIGTDDVTPLGNGASGLYFQKSGGQHYDYHGASGNTIANNGHAGIGFNPNVIGDFGNNTFLNNAGLALDAGMDGRTLNGRAGVPGHGGIIAAPTVATATYANGVTTITGFVPRPEATYVHYWNRVYVYANENGKDGGRLIATVVPDFSESASGTFTVEVPGDLRGQYVSAAAFFHLIYSWDDPAPGVSEASEPRLVQ